MAGADSRNLRASVTSHQCPRSTLIKGLAASSDIASMTILITKKRPAAPAYESPTGILVRILSLGVAIGFSLLAGATALALPDVAGTAPIWLVWIAGLVVSILVYGLASLVFRQASSGQSRRMRRWLQSGTG